MSSLLPTLLRPRGSNAASWGTLIADDAKIRVASRDVPFQMRVGVRLGVIVLPDDHPHAVISAEVNPEFGLENGLLKVVAQMREFTGPKGVIVFGLDPCGNGVDCVYERPLQDGRKEYYGHLHVGSDIGHTPILSRVNSGIVRRVLSQEPIHLHTICPTTRVDIFQCPNSVVEASFIGKGRPPSFAITEKFRAPLRGL